MATFGKRVPPKHRADPGERKGLSPPAPRSGSHASPALVDAPTPVDAPTLPLKHTLEPPANTPVPAAPELETPMSSELPAAPVSVSEPEPTDIHSAPMRVLIVDDNEDVRGLLRIAFARSEIEVVGAAGDSREALAMVQHDRPGIILLDVNLPQVAGLDLLPLLREHCPQARVVMFSAQLGNQVVETAMQRGAMGFIEKGVSMKSVLTHLHAVASAPEGQAVEPFPLRVYA